jgi:DNA-binding NarL/FixJ family response regulator
MIARFEGGNPVETMAMQVAAADVGLELPGLRAVLSAEPPAPERRSLASCPLTAGELRVVSKLAKGRVYKEIAAELDLAVSTVRTHLYNTYRKLGVPDRAHAILLAKENSDASRCRIAGLKRSTSELDLGGRRPRATPKRD